jgi:hypothetical protein
MIYVELMKASTRGSRRHITELYTSAPRRKTKKQAWPEKKLPFALQIGFKTPSPLLRNMTLPLVKYAVLVIH